MTNIWDNAPATSVQTVSMSSFRVWRAKTFSSASSSARKPKTPVADTMPGILGVVEGGYRALEADASLSGARKEEKEKRRQVARAPLSNDECRSS